jgi:hypothetical protein
VNNCFGFRKEPTDEQAGKIEAATTTMALDRPFKPFDGVFDLSQDPAHDGRVNLRPRANDLKSSSRQVLAHT